MRPAECRDVIKCYHIFFSLSYNIDDAGEPRKMEGETKLAGETRMGEGKKLGTLNFLLVSSLRLAMLSCGRSFGLLKVPRK